MSSEAGQVLTATELGQGQREDSCGDLCLAPLWGPPLTAGEGRARLGQERRGGRGSWEVACSEEAGLGDSRKLRDRC